MEEVGELLRYVRKEFGNSVDVSVVDTGSYILSLIDVLRYNVKKEKPVWVINGKKFYEGIPTKEELHAALS